MPSGRVGRAYRVVHNPSCPRAHNEHKNANAENETACFESLLALATWYADLGAPQEAVAYHQEAVKVASALAEEERAASKTTGTADAMELRAIALLGHALETANRADEGGEWFMKGRTLAIRAKQQTYELSLTRALVKNKTLQASRVCMCTNRRIRLFSYPKDYNITARDQGRYHQHVQ
jgi:hypothetical protein